MTFIDAMVRKKLLDTPTVADLVENRIFSNRLPRETTLPAIVVKMVDVVPDQDVPDAQSARVQVSVYSYSEESENERTPRESRVIVEAVKDTLHVTLLDRMNVQWTVGDKTYDILSCLCVLITSFVEPDTEYFHVPVDFVIEYRS